MAEAEVLAENPTGLFWIAGKREVYFKTREEVRLWAYYRCNYMYIYIYTYIIIYIYIYTYILEAVIASTLYSSTSLYSIGLANRGPVPSLFGQRRRWPQRQRRCGRHCEMLSGYADVLDLGTIGRFFSAKFGSNFQMGLSENVGLIFPMIASHLKTG